MHLIHPKFQLHLGLTEELLTSCFRRVEGWPLGLSIPRQHSVLTGSGRCAKASLAHATVPDIKEGVQSVP